MHPQHTSRYRAFQRRLREARVESGLTQAAVAKKLGRHQSFVAKIEQGERRVDVIELSDLARIYRKPLSYFLG